jgi:hypothetical protein
MHHLTEDVRLCHEHAEWCASQAETAVSKRIREDFSHLAQRWLKLARSYEIARTIRLESLTGGKGK